MSGSIVPVQTDITLPAVINGNNAAYLNEASLTFTPFGGGETGGVYEGPDAVIQTLITPLYLLGYKVSYKKSKSPTSTLSFSAAWSGSANGGAPVAPNNDFVNTWELVRNTVQKELLESGHPLVQNLNSQNLKEIKNAIAGTPPFTSDEEYFTFIPPVPPETTDPSYDAAVYLWALFQSGVKCVEVKQPILRVTLSTSQLYNAPFDVSNVDTILTTESMMADSGVPSSFAVPLIALADQLAAKTFYPNPIPNPPLQVRTDGLLIYFGWLKEITSALKKGQQRITYITEYKFGAYDANLYGVPQ